MKNCKYCQTEIDAKAKICPNCRKKQGMPKWLIIVLIILGISFLASLAGGAGDSEDKPSGSTQESITLLDGHSGEAKNEYSYEITGTLQNNTNNEYTYISVEFYTYDKDGNLLDTCYANNSGLEAKGKWKFTASCFFTDYNANTVKSYKLKDITKW